MHSWLGVDTVIVFIALDWNDIEFNVVHRSFVEGKLGLLQRCRSLMAHVLTFYTLSPSPHFSLKSHSHSVYLAPSLPLHPLVTFTYLPTLTFHFPLSLSLCLLFCFSLPPIPPYFFPHSTPLICFQFKNLINIIAYQKEYCHGSITLKNSWKVKPTILDILLEYMTLKITWWSIIIFSVT